MSTDFYIIIESANYFDRVYCEDFSEARDTILANFYDAYSIPIPDSDGEMFEDMTQRGYSIYFVPAD